MSSSTALRPTSPSKLSTLVQLSAGEEAAVLDGSHGGKKSLVSSLTLLDSWTAVDLHFHDSGNHARLINGYSFLCYLYFSYTRMVDG